VIHTLITGTIQHMANNISMIQPGDSKPEYGETITSWSSECLFDVYFTFILLEDAFS